MSSAFPNEPTGFTALGDWPASGSLASNMFNVYGTQDYATDATAPLSPSSVFDSFCAAGSLFGNGQWGAYFPNRPREVFVGFWWKTNAAFQGTSNNNNKLFFIRSPENSADNSFLVWQGAPDGAKTLKWYQQAQVNNTHVPGAFGMTWPVDGTGWFDPNVNAGAATFSAADTWRRVEIYLKSSTTATSKDGIIRIWANNTLSTNITTANIMYNGIEEWQINHAWDGSAFKPDVSRRWDHYFDHVYWSVRTSGGGGTPTSTLTSLTPVTVSLAPGNTQTMTVGMSNTVSANTSVALSSSNTAVATVPSSVTVNNGQASAQFTCTGVGAGTSTLTASLSGNSFTSAVTVTASSGGGGTGTTTTYSHTTQFATTQSVNGWSYRDGSGNLLSYNASGSIWQSGTHAYLGIWSNGCHPGYTETAVLRWTAPLAGSARITGSVQDLDTTAGTGVLFSVKYGASSTLYSKDLDGTDATAYPYDVTQSMSAGDYIDFIVDSKGSGAYDSTLLNPVITFTTGSTSSNPGAPTISSFTPTSGLRDSLVTITGTNFNTVLANNTVTINGTPCTVTSASTTQLVIRVANAATTGNLAVTTSNGTATGSTFTVTDPVTPDTPPASNFGGSAMLLLVLP